MKKGFNETKIEKDIEAFSIFSIYDTNFNDKDDIMNHIDEILDLYKDYNSVMFFINPYFEEISKKYINGDNNFDTKWYEQLINYCTRKLKVDKYNPNSLFCKKLYEYYEIVEYDKDVDDKTFSLIVNTYIHFANLKNMETYIFKRVFSKTNVLPRSTYINFINKLGNILFNQELKKYNKHGKFYLLNINDNDYSKDNISEYIPKDNKIIFSLKYLNQEKIIFNLQAIFHEINHVRQCHDKDYYDYEKNQIIKELFLNHVLEISYNKNYWSFKYEYDAEYKSIIDTMNFLKKYMIFEDNIIPILNQFHYKDSNLRIYNGEMVHIDQLFENAIKDNLSIFKDNYSFFYLEYDEFGNRYLISHFIVQKNLTDDKKIMRFYDDLIYKHCYSYKEILLNIKDLLNVIKKDKENIKEYKNVLLYLIGKKIMLETTNQFKNICYKGKHKIKQYI